MRSRLSIGKSVNLIYLIFQETRGLTAEDCGGFLRHIKLNIVNCSAEFIYIYQNMILKKCGYNNFFYITN